MPPEVHAFWLPKAGNTAEEYEDAFAFELESSRIALSDGATESSFADLWAQSLSRAFAAGKADEQDFDRWLEPLQAEWQASVPWNRLPWFAEEKARNGAFATLLGLDLLPAAPEVAPPPIPRPPSLWERLWRRKKESPPPPPLPPTPRWRAVAVGDTCLFQIRNDALVYSFPHDRSDQFNSRPLLLSSNPSWNHTVRQGVKNAESIRSGEDWFLLATDALSHWFLKQYELRRKPWNRLLEIRSQQDFQCFVEDARREGLMKNDDTTLIVARSPES